MHLDEALPGNRGETPGFKPAHHAFVIEQNRVRSEAAVVAEEPPDHRTILVDGDDAVPEVRRSPAKACQRSTSACEPRP
jgi:hypothetical protein